MSRHSLMRPLPLFFVFVFVAVAAVDLVRTLREEEPPPPVVLNPGGVRFEPREPVVDLRSRHDEPGVTILPSPVFVGELWSEADASGRWVLGHGAELTLELLRGDQSVLMFEGRPAAGKRPVRRVGISVNGVDCGTTSLRRGWQRWSVALPEGALRPGTNTIVFRVPDRGEVRKPRRALQLRQIEFRFHPTPTSGVASRDPVTVDFESQRLVMRTSGVLEARFTVDDRIDALRLKCIFHGPPDAAVMTVARPQGSGLGLDAEIQRVLSPSTNGVDRVRVPLHGRHGEFVMQISAEPGDGRFRLDIRSLELVTERNRSGIPEDRPG